MWSYINQIYSLEVKASAQVAINLCQEIGFKEVALRLEEPTYGNFISLYERISHKSSTWAKVRVDDRFCDLIQFHHPDGTDEKVSQWDTAVDEQSKRLMKGIPHRLRQKIQPWIKRIALEYLSYSRRQEVLFGVSRYFLMNTLTRGDWKVSARLDEKKIAERLLEDERLTVLQRYRMACVYCLLIHIPQLWERLIREEQRFTSRGGPCDLSKETHRLVLLWSWYMNSHQEEKVAFREPYPWYTVSRTISYGNFTALMVCWKEFPEDIRQEIVIDRALESLQQWQSAGKFGESEAKRKLVSHQSPEEQSTSPIEDFNLPYYYSELMLFFLSQMDQEQQLTFFKKAFQSEYRKSVIECFLEWPHQDGFLPTINQLWGTIPKDKYVLCLLTLATKYSEADTNANCDYDYRSLLRALWEETPEEYKQYVFCDREINDSVINEGKELLSQLVERSPFQEKDEALFKLIFHVQPQDKRRAMMHSEEGAKMCLSLMQKEKLSFLNELLEECLLKEEILDFKKRFIFSYWGVQLCKAALIKKREKIVDDLLYWSLASDAKKMQYTDELTENNDCLGVCEYLLYKEKLADVERMITYFSHLSSDEKEGFKVRFAQRACVLLYYTHGSLSEDCIWKEMDAIISWSVDTKEKIRDFKKELFSREGIDMHYGLVLVKTLQGKIKRFYQWFGLSPKEIKQLKRDTLFTPRFIEYIHKNLPEYTNTLVDCLRFCLTDEEMVIDLKKEVEEYCTDVSDKEQLNHLVSELLDGFRKKKFWTR